MMSLDFSMCASRRFHQAARADADGVILRRLAGGGREIASAMKLTASSSKALLEAAAEDPDAGCWPLELAASFLFLLWRTIRRSASSFASATESAESIDPFAKEPVPSTGVSAA